MTWSTNKEQKRFNTINDMLGYLSEYRHYYYRWIALDALLTTVRSPSLEENGGASPTPTDSRILQQLEDKAELEQMMETIKNEITLLKDVSYQSYTIMMEKFVYFKTLEEIALMTHYSIDHMKHELYPKAKADMFKLLNGGDGHG